MRSFRCRVSLSISGAALLLMSMFLFSQGAYCSTRFTFILRDASGNEYSVAISAKDEVKERVDRAGAYDAYNEGDVRVSGHYVAGLSRRTRGKPTIQRVKLFTSKDGRGEFNLSRNMVYVIPGRVKCQPDLLVVEQYGFNTCNEARIFFVKHAQLTLVTVTRLKGRPSNTIIFSTDERYRFMPTGPFRFKSAAFVRPDCCYYHSNWRFDPNNAELLEKKSYKTF